MARVIQIPVVLGGSRHLWSENGQPNGIFYGYCANHCLSANVHCGHDVEAIYEPIFAATDGVVKFGGPDKFYTPNHVDIEPTVGPFKGEYHIYGHLSEAWVSTGQTVVRGQQIGITGTNLMVNPGGSLNGPALGNEHLHWERRAGFSGCSLDPDPVLTSPDANGGDHTPPNGPVTFGRRDRIRVANGPLRVRALPGTGAAILLELPNGAQLCVTGRPERAEGFDWFPVRVVNVNQAGWVAGQFCALVEAKGCKDGPVAVAAPAPAGAAQPGQPIAAHPDTGPSGDALAELQARSAVVEYDAAGAFVGVTFPAPPPVVGAPGDTRFHSWAKG